MIEEDIRARLKQQVTALGERIYPLLMPQDVKLPAATYQRVSTATNCTLDGVSGLDSLRIRIDAWSKTFGEVQEIGKAIRDALDGYRGVGGAQPNILGVFLVTAMSLYEDGTKLHRLLQEFLVWGTED